MRATKMRVVRAEPTWGGGVVWVGRGSEGEENEA